MIRALKQATLCLIVRDSKILLAKKKRGFGAGKYNGYGGKPCDGESLREAAARELQEESSLCTDSDLLEKIAEFDFYYPYEPKWDQVVHVFKVHDYHGEPVESEEMAHCWFDLDKIPYNEMWDDDKYWLPLLLAGKKLKAQFVFRLDGSDSIVDSKNIEEVFWF